MSEQKEVGDKDGKSNFDRTHEQLDKRTGNDHDWVGSRRGEPSGIGDPNRDGGKVTK
jgi:hypothetical protein